MQPVILLADDHSMIRKGLRSSFQFDLGYTNVTEVNSCNELMSQLKKKIFTHLILDINLSDGSSLEILPNIRRLYPRLQIAVLTMQPAAVFRNVLKQYGVFHFLHKAASEEDTTRMLSQFLQNEQPARLPADADGMSNPFLGLSSRELEVLHYLLKGSGTNEIGERLNLKQNTISTFKTRIFEKTGTRNIQELAELAHVYKIAT
ncbi:MAG TPA: response regulator transcription factor [Puia sp.]|nr:response regulator transcription factor [Puia sp.]